MISSLATLLLAAAPTLVGETLADGMDVVSVQTDAKSCVLRVVVRAGSDRDPFGRGGVAHLVEHVVLAGPAGLEALRDPLATVNAYTTRDSTYFVSATSPEHCQEALKRLLWALSEGQFKESQVANEKRVILREELYSNPWQQTLLEGGLFGEVAPIAGTESSRDAIKVADLTSYYGEHYTPSRLAVITVGPLSPQDVRNVVKAAYTGLPGVELTAPPRRPRELREERERAVLSVPSTFLALAQAYPLSRLAECKAVANEVAIDLGRAALGPGVEATAVCAPVGGYAIVTTAAVAPTVGAAQSLKAKLLALRQTPPARTPAVRAAQAQRGGLGALALGRWEVVADDLAMLASWASHEELFSLAATWLAPDVGAADGGVGAPPQIYLLTGKEAR